MHGPSKARATDKCLQKTLVCVPRHNTQGVATTNSRLLTLSKQAQILCANA